MALWEAHSDAYKGLGECRKRGKSGWQSLVLQQGIKLCWISDTLGLNQDAGRSMNSFPWMCLMYHCCGARSLKSRVCRAAQTFPGA